MELVADKRTRKPISMRSAPHDVIRRETGVLERMTPDGAIAPR